jgi:CRP-like cAMP-binding protein
MTLERSLKTSRITAGLAEENLAELASLARKVEFQEDQIILLTGQRSTHFYLVLSGSVCVEVRTPVYNVCVQVLGLGEGFGWSSFLGHHDTLFQVRAREACTAACWDAPEISTLCRGNPEFGVDFFHRLLELVAGRVQATESKLAEFCGAHRPVYTRHS